MQLCARTRYLLAVHAALSVCSFECAGCMRPTLWLGATGATDAATNPPIDETPAPQPPAQAGSGQPPMVPEPDAAAPPSDAAQTPAVMTPATGAPAPKTAEHEPDAGLVPPSPRPDVDAGDDERAPPTRLPAPRTRCPRLTGNGVYVFGDPAQRTLSVQIYMAADARDKPEPGGPLILYWHAFGSNPSEVRTGFGQPAIDSVVQQGGVVAAFSSKLCATCGLPEDVGWYDDDDAVSDHVVGCAIAQAKIDVRRIHALGLSAGALHSLHLALVRSNYMASVVSYSGGTGVANAGPPTIVDGASVPCLLTYGREGLDAAGIDFNLSSRLWYEAYSPLGWYIMMCQHDGGHEIPQPVAAHVLQFLLDHPYGVEPEPYARRIPAVFPSYCQNSPPQR